MAHDPKMVSLQMVVSNQLPVTSKFNTLSCDLPLVSLNHGINQSGALMAQSGGYPKVDKQFFGPSLFLLKLDLGCDRGVAMTSSGRMALVCGCQPAVSVFHPPLVPHLPS